MMLLEKKESDHKVRLKKKSAAFQVKGARTLTGDTLAGRFRRKLAIEHLFSLAHLTVSSTWLTVWVAWLETWDSVSKSVRKISPLLIMLTVTASVIWSHQCGQSVHWMTFWRCVRWRQQGCLLGLSPGGISRLTALMRSSNGRLNWSAVWPLWSRDHTWLSSPSVSTFTVTVS